MTVKAYEPKKWERLCRYISRPAESEKRLSITKQGNVRYELKTPYRDGTTHVVYEPLDFMAKLVALVPKPRVNLTRYHDVFTPNSQHRALVTPARRGRHKKTNGPHTPTEQPSIECRAAMTWAQRLKRIFNIDIETCPKCAGTVKVIACIKDPVVIKKILTHLNEKSASAAISLLPASRVPPPVH